MKWTIIPVYQTPVPDPQTIAPATQIFVPSRIPMIPLHVHRYTSSKGSISA